MDAAGGTTCQQTEKKFETTKFQYAECGDQDGFVKTPKCEPNGELDCWSKNQI